MRLTVKELEQLTASERMRYAMCFKDAYVVAELRDTAQQRMGS